MKTVGFHNAVSLNWLDVRTDFIDYLSAKGYDARVAKDYVSYLDKHAPVLSGPFDVISLFTNVKTARRHVAMSLRVLFNFYEMLGYSKGFLDSLRKALPKVQCGIDLKIPSEEKVVDSLRKSHRAPLKYRALRNLLLDSGLRLVEAVELINNFRDTETINGFYRCELTMFRGAKLTDSGSTKKGAELLGKMYDRAFWRNMVSPAPASREPAITDKAAAKGAVEKIVVIKEIVKIRCPYCGGLYDEVRDRCPNCGGKR